MFQQIFGFERLLCIYKAEFQIGFYRQRIHWGSFLKLLSVCHLQSGPAWYWPSLVLSIHQVRWAGGRLPPLWQTTSRALPTTNTRLPGFSIWTVAGGTEIGKYQTNIKLGRLKVTEKQRNFAKFGGVGGRSTIITNKCYILWIMST